MLILIADDLDDAREAMKLLLQGIGHNVIEAVNGRQAVEMAARHSPDLILMDLNMRVMDGVAAVGLIRREKAALRVPIFALSANPMGDAYVVQALAAGCDAYFPKPVDFDALCAAIASVAPVTTESVRDPLHSSAVASTLDPIAHQAPEASIVSIRSDSPPVAEAVLPEAITHSSGGPPDHLLTPG